MLDTSFGKFYRLILLHLQYGLTVLMRLYSEKYSDKEKALERLRGGEAWDTVAWDLAEHAKRERK
jgi:hypothetical protein